MSEEGESGFFGSFTCLTKISITPPTDEYPATSNSPSTSTSDKSGDWLPNNQSGLLKPVPLYKQNLNSYTRKKARRQKYLKDMLMYNVVSKSNAAGMMSALLQLNGRNSGIVDQSLLELWRQVVLGKPDKNRQDTSVTKVVRPSLKKGDLALVYLAKYAGEWPQMGRIVEVLKDEKCTLHWHKGSMTGSWSQCSIPVRGEKGKRVPWIEEIPISSVWFYGFSLTPAGKLSQKTKDQISNFSDF